MFKKLFCFFAAFAACAVFAAVDVNKADQASLESVKGIGTSLSGKILDERKKGAYKDWPDLVERVRGLGAGNASRLSAQGLTVNGEAFKSAATAVDKPAGKAAKASGKPAKSDDGK